MHQITRQYIFVSENALGAESYWLAAAHIYSPLPFRPGKGKFGDLFKTHFFVNAGNLGNVDFSKFGYNRDGFILD